MPLIGLDPSQLLQGAENRSPVTVNGSEPEAISPLRRRSPGMGVHQEGRQAAREGDYLSPLKLRLPPEMVGHQGVTTGALGVRPPLVRFGGQCSRFPWRTFVGKRRTMFRPNVTVPWKRGSESKWARSLLHVLNIKTVR
jgi:hypothetical protein